MGEINIMNRGNHETILTCSSLCKDLLQNYENHCQLSLMIYSFSSISSLSMII